MATITAWLLIAISSGMYNGGTVTTVAHLPEGKDCAAMKTNLERQGVSSKLYCVPGTILVPGK